MINVTVKSEPADGSGIVAWTETLEDPRQPLAEVAAVMRADIQERWDSETDPWGGSWAARSIHTLEIREKLGRDPIPGKFFASALSTQDGKAVDVGFSNPIPRWFHDGNPNNRVFGRGRGPRPARPVLPLKGGTVDLPADLEAALMEAFRGEMVAEIRRRTGG